MRNGRTLVLALAILLTSSLAFAAGPVDVNTADAPALAQAMNGIGMSKAEAIIAYRTEHGPFAKIEDLIRVKGVGAATVEKNRSRIMVAAPAKAKKTSSGK